MRRKMAPSLDEIRALADVAQGNQKADLVIVGGDVVCVYTGEILKNWSVATKGQRIAYVGEDAGHTIGPDTKVIDASGKTIIPGLINGHAHLIVQCNQQEILQHIIPGGTTTIVTETLEIAFSLGISGIDSFLESASTQPIKILSLAPPMSTNSKAVEAEAMDIDTLRGLLERDDVIGLGETYWSSLFQDDGRLLGLVAETLAMGKRVEGHSAGAKGKRLVSYVSTGVTSCHESTNAAEALERLRLGLHTMIRGGGMHLDLASVSKIKDEGIDTRRLALVTDGIFPEQLVNSGHMESVLQQAIELGFDPVNAIQMSTLNVAEHFGIDSDLGGIAPGKYADIVIIPDPRTIKAEYVISNGQVIARNGMVLVEAKPFNLPKETFGTDPPIREMKPEDFSIKIDTTRDSVKVRVMSLVTNLVTVEEQIEVPVSAGQINIDTERDMVKASLISLNGDGEKIFTGLLKGFGIKTGALATSFVSETRGIMVVGADEGDMAEAVNRVTQMKGGMVVCAGGKIRAELHLPMAGISSDQPIAVHVELEDNIRREMETLGCRLPKPQITMAIFTSPAIPFFRMSEDGLIDSKTGHVFGLLVED